MFKIINLKFPQLNATKETKVAKIFKALKMPKIPAKFHPPLYVLTFGLITSMVVLGITTLWYKANPPVAYTADNLIQKAEAEIEVVLVEPSQAQGTIEVAVPPNLTASQGGQAAEQEQTAAVEPAEQVTTNSTPDLRQMQHPIEGQISPGFEFVYSEIYQDFRLHPGFDYSAQEGSKVLAVLEGVVGKVEVSPTGGYIVTLKHGDGWETSYTALTALETELKENQYVAQGTLLGHLVGAVPGEEENGTHLHFELRKDGTAVDPSQYLR